MPSTTLRKAWDEFIKSFKTDLGSQSEQVERAISFMRMREQLWTALEERSNSDDGGWAWPIDIFVDNDGSLFSIVAQSGKLYQVPLTVSGDNLSLGDWTQVTEVFQPVSQSTFRITRQKDGSHRWIGVVATSVLNRVGEIDSRDLFDSFVEDTAETGDWPRVDFYHLGHTNEKAWEFGTVDFHCREDYCYIMSGVFDEKHPLAKATIRAYEEDPEKWGFSIEFYAFGEPEVIVVEPEVRVPVYKRGRIIRVSIVREKDAASLFTRVANITEEKVRMKRGTIDALSELFGSDDAANKFLDQFGVNVDEVNRTVTDDNLVHRSKEEPVAQSKEAPTPDEKVEDEDEEENDDILELDEAGIAALTAQVMASPQFQAIGQALIKIQTTLDDLAKARAVDAKDIAALKESETLHHKRLGAVEKSEQVKKTEYLQDLPARTVRKATYRPREENTDKDEEGQPQEEDMSLRAERTLARIPTSY